MAGPAGLVSRPDCTGAEMCEGWLVRPSGGQAGDNGVLLVAGIVCPGEVGAGVTEAEVASSTRREMSSVGDAAGSTSTLAGVRTSSCTCMQLSRWTEYLVADRRG